MIAPDEIRRRVVSALPGADVRIEDLTGTADHYRIAVVASAFEGMSSLQRHRAVQASLRDVLGGALHAIELTTRTPDEAGAAPK